MAGLSTVKTLVSTSGAARGSPPAMLANRAPSTLLALGYLPVVLTVPYISISDGYLYFGVWCQDISFLGSSALSSLTYPG